MVNALQSVFPGFFQLGCDQPIVGIDGSVTPLGQRGIIPSLLQFEIGDALLLPVLLLQHALGLLCRLDRHRLYRLKHLRHDNIIDTAAAKDSGGVRPAGSAGHIDRPAAQYYESGRRR